MLFQFISLLSTPQRIWYLNLQTSDFCSCNLYDADGLLHGWMALWLVRPCLIWCAVLLLLVSQFTLTDNLFLYRH